MRTYYLFPINKTFYTLYENKPSLLFQNFYHIYKKNCKYDNMLGGIYFQLVKSINKKELNEYIYIRHKDQLAYHFYNKYHIIKNIYINEITKLIINNTFIKISTNKSYPSFFRVLDQYFDNVFICDFDNYDYFWLDELLKQTLV